MKHRRRITEIKDQSSYHHDHKLLNQMWKITEKNRYEFERPSEIPYKEKSEKYQFNKKKPKYKKNPDRDKITQQTKKRQERLNKILVQYLNLNDQEFFRQKKLSKKKTEGHSASLEKNSLSRNHKRKPSRRHKTIELSKEQRSTSRPIKLAGENDFSRNPSPINRERLLPSIKSPTVQRKVQNHNYYQIFTSCCQLSTYFQLNSQKQENQRNPQNLAFSLLQSQIKLNKIPTQKQLEVFIRQYEPQNIKIQELKTMKDYALKLIQGQSLYFGQVSKGLRNGIGIHITRKAIHEGKFKNDFIIQGIEKKGTSVYEGNFHQGKRQGQGSCIWSNGEEYSGEWQNNKKNGKGYWKSKQNDTYIGEWKNGKAHGYGVYKKSTGQKYEGEFDAFEKHGKGSEEFPNGDKYEGEYQSGQATGKGIYRWSKGVKYEGQFINGFLAGKGILSYNKAFEYDGKFNEKGPTGIGRLKLGNGDIFHGQFKNGKMNGFGRMQVGFTNEVQEGYWVDNKLLSVKGI